MSDSTPQSIGKYEILSVLGKGGMGIVYKGRDPFIDRVVAIKTIGADEFGDDKEMVARLRMEAKSAGRLHHPNIVTIFELGEQPPLVYLAMEYVEGANLANVIASRVHLGLDTKLDIITQLCDGIAYAHDQGVVHRDIKPANICLTQRGDPKILDFGLARFDQTRLTKTGLTSGTLMYMSPERMRGETGPSDDIFALGAVCYEILTGHNAFPGDSFRQIVGNIMSGHYPTPPSRVLDVPPQFDAVIAKATAVERANRYATAADLGRAFRDIQHSPEFRKRVDADKAASATDSMRTVAIQFSMANPYTAPDIGATAAGIAQQHGDDVYTARTESISVQTFAQDSFAQEATAMHPGHADVTAPVRKVVRNDAVSEAPTEMMEAVSRKAAPSSWPVNAPAPAAPAAPAQPADARADDSLITRTRTIVANAFKKREPSGAKSGAKRRGSGAAPKAAASGAAAAPSRPVSAIDRRAVKPAFLYAGAATLAVALGAIAMAADAGAIVLLSLYAAAVAGWVFVFNHSNRMKKMQVAMLAVALCAVAAVVPTIDPPQLAHELELGRNVLNSQVTPANSGGVAPFASALLAGWAAIGGGALVRRLIGAAALLVAGWLLWDKDRPRLAVGVMTFPLLLIEGIVHARLEIIAAALLVAAVTASVKRRYGLAAFAGVLAAGVTITAISALPVLYGAAWYMVVFLASAATTLVVPKIILPSVTGWTTSLSTLSATSPVLAFLNGRVASLLAEWGVIDFLNAISKAITTRAGTAPRIVSGEVLATLIIVVALFVAISVIAARAETLEAAMADGLALFLIVTMTRDAALWMLVAPFAIISTRRLWLLVAICSPLLMLQSTDARSSLILWSISVGIPLVLFIVMKLQKSAPAEAVPAM
jgi:hypothetical protein